MEQLEDAPHVLLRGLVMPVAVDGFRHNIFGAFVVFLRFEEDAREIESFRRPWIHFERLDKMLLGAGEILEIDEALGGDDVGMKIVARRFTYCRLWRVPRQDFGDDRPERFRRERFLQKNRSRQVSSPVRQVAHRHTL